MLTKTQEDLRSSSGLSLLANDAVGIKRDVNPSHDEAYFNKLKITKTLDSKESYDTYLHGMDEVIDSTERTKAADESVLKDCKRNRR